MGITCCLLVVFGPLVLTQIGPWLGGYNSASHQVITDVDDHFQPEMRPSLVVQYHDSLEKLYTPLISSVLNLKVEDCERIHKI
jgi:hypothetical protein